MPRLPLKSLISQVGKLECTSDWTPVNQEMIDQFANATNDRQYIHINPERAQRETPFGGTIAHGFLTVSLLTSLLNDCMPRAEEAVIHVNYGFDRLRFVNPVRAGKRIRAKFTLAEINERKINEYLFRYSVVVEIENEEKPALIAEWLGLTITDNQEA